MELELLGITAGFGGAVAWNSTVDVASQRVQKISSSNAVSAVRKHLALRSFRNSTIYIIHIAIPRTIHLSFISFVSDESLDCSSWQEAVSHWTPSMASMFYPVSPTTSITSSSLPRALHETLLTSCNQLPWRLGQSGYDHASTAFLI